MLLLHVMWRTLVDKMKTFFSFVRNSVDWECGRLSHPCNHSNPLQPCFELPFTWRLRFRLVLTWTNGPQAKRKLGANWVLK